MTNNARRPKLLICRSSVRFSLLLTQAPSPLRRIPCKEINRGLDPHLSFVVWKFSAGAQCVWVSVCVSNLEGRRIICCNCCSAGSLLTDRNPRYGCWTVSYQYFSSAYWQLSGRGPRVSSLLTLQVAGCVIPVCQWEILRCLFSYYYSGLRCGLMSGAGRQLKRFRVPVLCLFWLLTNPLFTKVMYYRIKCRIKYIFESRQCLRLQHPSTFFYKSCIRDLLL